MTYVCEKCKQVLPITTIRPGLKIEGVKVVYDRLGAPEFALCDKCERDLNEWLGRMVPKK